MPSEQSEYAAVVRELRQIHDEISRFAEGRGLPKDLIEETRSHLLHCASGLEQSPPLPEWQAKRRIEQALSALDDAMYMADEFTAVSLRRIRVRLVSIVNGMRTAAA